jgi:hypothetical protein
MALVVGGACLVALSGIGAVACSSDNGSGTPTTVLPDATSGTDTGAGSHDGGVVGNDTGTPGDDSGNPGDDSGPTADGGCASPPALFPPKADGGIYCPYSKDFSIDGGKAAYCNVGTEVCCLSPSSDAGLSTCKANSTACPAGDHVWACSAPQECGGGQVCCLTSGPVEPDPKCSGYQKTKGFFSTRCAAAAECTGTVEAGSFIDNQYIACEAQADCPTGKTCTAVKTSGTSIGVCL